MILLGLGALDRVEHVGAVLPHVELGAGDRRAGRVEHPAVDPAPARPAPLSTTMLSPYSRSGEPGHVERAEHGRLGGAGGQLVRERVDQHRQAERVRPQDELLPALVGDVAGGGEHRDQLAPLLLGQPDARRRSRADAGRALCMSSRSAGIRARIEARDRRRGDVRRRGLARVGRRHRATPPRPLPPASGSRRAASPGSTSSSVRTRSRMRLHAHRRAAERAGERADVDRSRSPATPPPCRRRRARRP